MNEMDQCNINTTEKSYDTLMSLDIIPDTEQTNTKVEKKKSVKKGVRRMRRFRLTVKKKHKKRLGPTGPVSSMETKESTVRETSENGNEGSPHDGNSTLKDGSASGEECAADTSNNVEVVNEDQVSVNDSEENGKRNK